MLSDPPVAPPAGKGTRPPRSRPRPLALRFYSRVPGPLSFLFQPRGYVPRGRNTLSGAATRPGFPGTASPDGTSARPVQTSSPFRVRTDTRSPFPNVPHETIPTPASAAPWQSASTAESRMTMCGRPATADSGGRTISSRGRVIPVQNASAASRSSARVWAESSRNGPDRILRSSCMWAPHPRARPRWWQRERMYVPASQEMRRTARRPSISRRSSDWTVLIRRFLATELRRGGLW